MQCGDSTFPALAQENYWLLGSNSFLCTKMIPLSPNLRQLHGVFPVTVEEIVRVKSNGTCLKARNSCEHCSFPRKCQGVSLGILMGFFIPIFLMGKHRKVTAAGCLAGPGGPCLCGPPRLLQAGPSSPYTACTANAVSGRIPGEGAGLCRLEFLSAVSHQMRTNTAQIALPVFHFLQGSSPHPQP